MMEDIELIHKGGPYGDETCSYDVKTKAETVGEFIDMLLKTGDEYIKVVLKCSDDVAVAYITKRGGITRKADEYQKYREVKIDKVFANGGWGAITYDITPEEGQEIPKQDRLNFSMVYWGYDIWGRKDGRTD